VKTEKLVVCRQPFLLSNNEEERADLEMSDVVQRVNPGLAR
jgi:hypothetical protein